MSSIPSLLLVASTALLLLGRLPGASPCSLAPPIPGQWSFASINPSATGPGEVVVSVSRMSDVAAPNTYPTPSFKTVVLRTDGTHTTNSIPATAAGFDGQNVAAGNFTLDPVGKVLVLHDLNRNLSLANITGTLTREVVSFGANGQLYFLLAASQDKWMVSTPNTTAAPTSPAAPVKMPFDIDVLKTRQSSVRVWPEAGVVALPAVCCLCVDVFYYFFNTTGVYRSSSLDGFTYYDPRNQALVLKSSFNAVSYRFLNGTSGPSMSLDANQVRQLFDKTFFSKFTSSEMSQFQSCSEDSQCVGVTNGCCDCANGGEESAVASSHKWSFDQSLRF